VQLARAGDARRVMGLYMLVLREARQSGAACGWDLQNSAQVGLIARVVSAGASRCLARRSAQRHDVTPTGLGQPGGPGGPNGPDGPGLRLAGPVPASAQ